MAQKFRTALRPETFFPLPACGASLSDKRGIMIRGEGRRAKLTSQVRGRWDGTPVSVSGAIETTRARDGCGRNGTVTASRGLGIWDTDKNAATARRGALTVAE